MVGWMLVRMRRGCRSCVKGRKRKNKGADQSQRGLLIGPFVYLQMNCLESCMDSLIVVNEASFNTWMAFFIVDREHWPPYWF